jgi:hypothetical protein
LLALLLTIGRRSPFHQREATMSESHAQHLHSSLQDWESQYVEVRRQLTLSDLYSLWLRLFRLSRLLIKDYNTLMRAGTLACDSIAYTGDTKRLG